MGDNLNIGNLSQSAGATPLLTRQRFADLVGVTHDTVNKWIDRGYIPVVSVGRWSLVNVALLNARCLDRECKSFPEDPIPFPVQPSSAVSQARTRAGKSALVG